MRNVGHPNLLSKQAGTGTLFVYWRLFWFVMLSWDPIYCWLACLLRIHSFWATQIWFLAHLIAGSSRLFWAPCLATTPGNVGPEEFTYGGGQWAKLGFMMLTAKRVEWAETNGKLKAMAFFGRAVKKIIGTTGFSPFFFEVMFEKMFKHPNSYLLAQVGEKKNVVVRSCGFRKTVYISDKCHHWHHHLRGAGRWNRPCRGQACARLLSWQFSLASPGGSLNDPVGDDGIPHKPMIDHRLNGIQMIGHPDFGHSSKASKNQKSTGGWMS